jgi:hypothetical protein
VENVKYLGSVFNYARSNREIESRIAMAKAAFGKKALFTSKLGLNLMKKLLTFWHRSFTFKF